MTKKDYELLAQTIREGTGFTSNRAHALFAVDMAHSLAGTNPRFDRSKFLSACMPRFMVGTRLANVWERLGA